MRQRIFRPIVPTRRGWVAMGQNQDTGSSVSTIALQSVAQAAIFIGAGIVISSLARKQNINTGATLIAAGAVASAFILRRLMETE